MQKIGHCACALTVSILLESLCPYSMLGTIGLHFQLPGCLSLGISHNDTEIILPRE
jgi:hypothetical protein